MSRLTDIVIAAAGLFVFAATLPLSGCDRKEPGPPPGGWIAQDVNGFLLHRAAYGEKRQVVRSLPPRPWKYGYVRVASGPDLIEVGYLVNDGLNAVMKMTPKIDSRTVELTDPETLTGEDRAAAIAVRDAPGSP